MVRRGDKAAVEEDHHIPHKRIENFGGHTSTKWHPQHMVIRDLNDLAESLLTAYCGNAGEGKKAWVNKGENGGVERQSWSQVQGV